MKEKLCEVMVPVYEFRPMIENPYQKIHRYNNGEWTVDDGEYDLAFTYRTTAYYFHVPPRPGIIWSWTKNGDWGADVAEHPRGNAWHYMLREDETAWGDCWNKRKHENQIAGDEAMDFVVSKHGGGNGEGPEFHINDPYIAKGLVRIRDTKEVVRFPQVFNCMYCGEIDWRKVEAK